MQKLTRNNMRINDLESDSSSINTTITLSDSNVTKLKRKINIKTNLKQKIGHRLQVKLNERV